MGGIQASVVIPALNAGSTIRTQLRALSNQRAAFEWEVIVVDNGSTDDTVSACHEFDGVIPHLRVIPCERRGTSAARNAGASAARSDRLLFCDADDEVGEGWVAALVSALDAADAAGGAIESERLNTGRRPHLPRHPDHLPVVAGFLPRAISANLGVRREVFAAVGGFAEPYTYGADDTDFCWRLQMAGHELTYAPLAVVHYRYRDSPRATAIKAFRLGEARAHLFRDYQHRGMPRPRVLPMLFRWARLGAVSLVAPFSGRARSWCLEHVSAAAGQLRGSVRYRVWYL